MTNAEILKQWESEERELLFTVLSSVTPQMYNKAVEMAFDFLVRRTEEMREGAFDKYRELALKDVPYIERLNAVDKAKVQWCDSELESLKSRRRNYQLIPLHEWLHPSDGATIKALGFSRFMQLHLEEALVPLQSNSSGHE